MKDDGTNLPEVMSERNTKDTSLIGAPIGMIRAQVNAIQQLMQEVMSNGTHFGTIPGCGPKPTLLKPGAEKIGMLFRFGTDFVMTMKPLELPGHREYTVKCVLSDRDGHFLGNGIGSCSTMEKKYRYRKDQRGNQGENPDIADIYNTVLKMAKKRAHVDAILTVTAASDIFTQDIEDLPADDERTIYPESGVEKLLAKTPTRPVATKKEEPTPTPRVEPETSTGAKPEPFKRNSKAEADLKLMRQAAVDGYHNLGVMQATLEAYVGVPVDEWEVFHITELSRIIKEIKADKDGTVKQKYFPASSVPDELIPD